MKITRLRFDRPGPGTLVTLRPPPSGSDEEHLWQLDGDVVREAAGLPLAAVAPGKRIQVVLQIQTSPKPEGPIWVGATPHAAHSLGPIADVKVERSKWSGGKCTVTFSLDASPLGAGGVDEHHVAWRWHWRSTAGGTRHHFGTSEHLLFVTIGSPTLPWSATGTSTGPRTAPWSWAMSQACRWAQGARTRSDAASRIVRALFELGEGGTRQRLRYNGSLEKYLSAGLGNPRWFNCELFLDDLADDGQMLTINCYEGGVIVTTFANLLGCALVPGVLEGDCTGDLALNRVHPLGLPDTEAPSAFVFHVVAMEKKGQSGLADDLVYDAVVRIDEDDTPQAKPGPFVIADGVKLGTRTSKPGTGRFLPQLIAAAAVDRCTVRTMGRPWVGAEPAEQDRVDRCPLIRYVAYLRDLQRTDGAPPSFSPVPTVRIDGFEKVVELYSRRSGIRRTFLPPLPRETRLLFSPVGSGGGRRAVQVDLWTDDDRWTVMSFAAEVLAMAEIPPTRQDVRGSWVFTDRRHRSLLTLTPGGVVRLASVGSVPIDMVALYETAVRISSPGGGGQSRRS